ncbi:hypothetical protein ABE321_07195 [Bacillus paralicheniformis]|uniref:hypothetical protein n=1 Tax=Bacillus paralicheniformis TaxID=1648923 RepID=UPI0011A06319|nr:hypothetical protein [Bacillus paralicheniformis]MCU4666576.1 hypothetical protein [Bacillus paralicheniformis]MEC1823515.1 hypothetical protein [Bacillus paralicheniformis]TWJ39832.1 hypothetical protein CHCC5027_1413 [Bacillus paralicheniformis]TWK24862.1 hypothetical protein CHCC20372_2390 [Bacillus paralicheniformis]
MFTKEKFSDYFLNIILPTVIAVVFNWASTYYNGTSTVTIGQSTKLSDQYILPISINAYKDIDKLKITFPTKLNENQISSNKSLHIKSIDNNIGVDNESTFEITKIAEESSVQLLISTKKAINDKNINVDKNGNNLSVYYEAALLNPAQKQLLSIILNGVLLFLILNFVLWLTEKRRKRDYKRMRNLIRDSRRDLRARARDFETLKNDLDREKYKSAKARILLQAKLNDYKKELSFWRNTIRKVLYEIPDGEKKAEKLIGTVTSSLETYETNEKNQHDFETLKVAAALLRDSDENS